MEREEGGREEEREREEGGRVRGRVKRARQATRPNMLLPQTEPLAASFRTLFHNARLKYNEHTKKKKRKEKNKFFKINSKKKKKKKKKNKKKNPKKKKKKNPAKNKSTKKHCAEPTGFIDN